MPLLASSQHRAVSFDVDGTMYDFKRHRVHLLPSLLGNPRLLLTYREVVAGLRGEAHADLRAELCRRIGARIGLPQERVNQKLNHSVYGAWPASFRPSTALKDLPLLLRVLDAEGVPRVVISDHPAHAKLENMGISEGWAAVIDGEAVGAFKPHPRAIERAAQALGLEPAQILHVGDRADTDGAMAEAVGATCLIRGRDWDSMDQLGRLLFGKPWPELRRAHGG